MDRSDIELFEAYIDNRMTENDMDRFRELLRTNAKARAYLRSLTTLDSGLHDLAFSPPELQDPHLWEASDPAAGFVKSGTEKQRKAKRIQGIFSKRFFVAAAALVAGIVLILAVTVLTPERKNDYIATVVSANSVADTVPMLNQGERLSRDPIEVTSGVLQLRFDSGARITVHGPARFVPIDERGGILQYGTLIGKAPDDRRGLRVVGPNFEVTDLGTEFALNVDTAQGSTLYVLEGSVALKPHGGKSVTVNQDGGYYIDLQNEMTAMDKLKAREAFGEVLLVKSDPFRIITPDTVAVYSFTGDRQEQWRELITNSPIRARKPDAVTTGPQGEARANDDVTESHEAGADKPANRPDLNIESPLSIEAHLYVDPHTADKVNSTVRLFSNEHRAKNNKTGWGVYLKEYSDGHYSPIFAHHMVKDYAFPQAKIPEGRWVHIVFTVDDSTVRLFMDGVLQGESARDGKMRKDRNSESSVAGKLLMTTRSNNPIGQVSYIAIHRRVLSEHEIRNRIAAGNAP